MPKTSSQAESLFLSALPAIEECVRFVCRRRRCSHDEAEEFASVARLHLIDGDCRVLRRHRGESSLRTYLVVVLDRLLVDERRRRWGVWRPCAEARRRGPVAVRLDQLLYRDQLPLDEAIAQLRTNEGVTLDEVALRALAAQLPARARRREEGEEALATLPAPADVAEPGALAREREARRRSVLAGLRDELRRLPDEDALVMRLRFGQGLTVARIAQSLGLEAKPLYRRVERLLHGLRLALAARGVGASDAAELLEGGAWDESEDLWS